MEMPERPPGKVPSREVGAEQRLGGTENRLDAGGDSGRGQVVAESPGEDSVQEKTAQNRTCLGDVYTGWAEGGRRNCGGGGHCTDQWSKFTAICSKEHRTGSEERSPSSRGNSAHLPPSLCPSSSTPVSQHQYPQHVYDLHRGDFKNLNGLTTTGWSALAL